MSAGTIIWIYQDIQSNCLIAKRAPFQYQSVVDIKTSEIVQVFTSGFEMVCPVWNTQTQLGDHRYATFDGVVYDITDLLDVM
jgi:hypothetical protein